VADPIAKQIVEAVRDRLYAIKPGAGYNTNPVVLPIGQQPALREHLDNNYVIGLWEQADSVDEARLNGNNLITQNIVIEGTAKRSQDLTEFDELHLLWQDIAKAVFTSDATLGGLALAVFRGPRVWRASIITFCRRSSSVISSFKALTRSLSARDI